MRSGHEGAGPTDGSVAGGCLLLAGESGRQSKSAANRGQCSMASRSRSALCQDCRPDPKAYAEVPPTMGALRGIPPSDPTKRADPKLKMPPSLAISQ